MYNSISMHNINIFPKEEGYYMGLNPRGMGMMIFHICKDDEMKWLIFDSFEKSKASDVPSVGIFTIKDYRWFNIKINTMERVICKKCNQLIKV